MFTNIGKTIKRVSAAVFIFQVILFIIIGAVVINMDEDLVFVGLCIMAAGAFIAWLSVLATYGFGELVDRAISIDETLNQSKQPHAQPLPRIGKCDICGVNNVALKEIKFNNGIETTNKNVCQNCISRMNSSPMK